MNDTGAPRSFRPETAQAKPKILVELRPCSIDYAGISQETRLIYSVLSELPEFHVGGLLNAFHDLVLPRSVRNAVNKKTDAGEQLSKAAFKQARLLWALESEIQGVRSSNKILKLWRSLEKKDLVPSYLRHLVASRQSRLLPFDSILFDDFVWTRYFQQTLPASDRERIIDTEYYAIEKGWVDAHFGCRSRRTSAKINTSGWDFFFCQVPTPFVVSTGTKIVVRYHDSIPLFFTHTVNGYDLKRFYWGLRASIRNGAFFACTSQPVHQELIRLFPEVEQRSTVIPDIVSDQFYKETSTKEKLGEILYRRKCPETSPPPKARPSRPKCIKEPYMVSVSTLEPRKNYRFLLEAWAVACQRLESPPLLVMVANLGWRNAEDVEELKPLIKAGRVAHLTRVGLHELRALYSGAHAVVCPSRSEGFDLSGVEAMLCETPVIASDIAVHRSVYGDAALYFDPYDVNSCANMLVEALSMPKDSGLLASLRDKGTERAKLYTRDAIGPQWANLFHRLAGRGTGTASTPSPVFKGQSPVLSDAELA